MLEASRSRMRSFTSPDPPSMSSIGCGRSSETLLVIPSVDRLTLWTSSTKLWCFGSGKEKSRSAQRKYFSFTSSSWESGDSDVSPDVRDPDLIASPMRLLSDRKSGLLPSSNLVRGSTSMGAPLKKDDFL